MSKNSVSGSINTLLSAHLYRLVQSTLAHMCLACGKTMQQSFICNPSLWAMLRNRNDFCDCGSGSDFRKVFGSSFGSRQFLAQLFNKIFFYKILPFHSQKQHYSQKVGLSFQIFWLFFISFHVGSRSGFVWENVINYRSYRFKSFGGSFIVYSP
jgi:hypothetical protein